jgi:hypothetical protein
MKKDGASTFSEPNIQTIKPTAPFVNTQFDLSIGMALAHDLPERFDNVLCLLRSFCSRIQQCTDEELLQTLGRCELFFVWLLGDWCIGLKLTNEHAVLRISRD